MRKTFNQISHSGDYREDDVSVSLTVLGGTYGGGSETIVVIKSQDDMQNTTGTLSPGAHPGSYNGQDAYNDMFVVSDGNGKRGERTTESNVDVAYGEHVGSDARSASNFDGGV